MKAVWHRVLWLAPLLTGLVYLEIVFGTLLRHPLIDSWTSWSLVWVWAKVITVGILFGGMVYLLILVSTLPRGNAIPRRIYLLASLFLLQVILAGTTWVANYGWPKWFTNNIANWNYTVVKEGVLQVWVTTAHAAVGSLVLVAAVNLTVWSWRLLRGQKG